MGLRASLLNVVLSDLPNSNSAIDRSSPRFDELQGGKIGPGRWRRYEDPNDNHQYGTSCATTLVGWLLEIGAPSDMLNADAPGGSGFKIGDHFPRLINGAKTHGWWRAPNTVSAIRPGDIFFLNHGPGTDHVGMVVSVTPNSDGSSFTVETADGGQNSKGTGGLADIKRQVRTFTSDGRYSAAYSSGNLTGWIALGGDAADDIPGQHPGDGPSDDGGMGGAPTDTRSALIPALIITASAFAIFYAAVSGFGKSDGGSMASAPRRKMMYKKGVLQTESESINLKRIGRGTFATIYRETSGQKRVFAFLPPGVDDKKIAALAYDAMPDNPHLPAIEYFGSTPDFDVYVMPFYRTPLRKDAALGGWDDYKTIVGCLEESEDRYRPGKRQPAKRGVDRRVNAGTVRCAKKHGVSAPVAEALGELQGMSKHFSPKYIFEFSPRNLATDDDGNLVLLDVLFDRKLVPWEYKPNAARK